MGSALAFGKNINSRNSSQVGKKAGIGERTLGSAVRP